MWSRISDGQSWSNGQAKGQAKTFNWVNATEACKDFHLAGFGDWRLPSKSELESLINQGKAGYHAPNGVLERPDSRGFGRYWSSSPHTLNSKSNSRWMLSFDSGALDYYLIESRFYIRVVRNAN